MTSQFSQEDILPERPELPEELSNTEAHLIVNRMGLVVSRLEQVADFETGGTRAKHFGAWVGLSIVPHLDQQMSSPEAPLILPEPPNMLVVADTLDELAERIKFEADVMVQTAKDVMSGKIKLDENGVPVQTEESNVVDFPARPTAEPSS
jgi:hypothetical protein